MHTDAWDDSSADLIVTVICCLDNVSILYLCEGYSNLALVWIIMWSIDWFRNKLLTLDEAPT